MRTPLFLPACLALLHTVAAKENIWRAFTITVKQSSAIDALDISEDDIVLVVGVASGKKGRTSEASFDLGSIREGHTLNGWKRGISHVFELPSNDSKNTPIVWGMRNVLDATEQQIDEVIDCNSCFCPLHGYFEGSGVVGAHS